MIERSIKIENGLYETLKYIAMLEGVPISWVIRQALWDFQKNYKYPSPFPLTMKNKRSP